MVGESMKMVKITIDFALDQEEIVIPFLIALSILENKVIGGFLMTSLLTTQKIWLHGDHKQVLDIALATRVQGVHYVVLRIE